MPGPSVDLPGYIWDATTPGGCYRLVNADGAPGRRVDEKEIAAYLVALCDDSEKQLSLLAAAVMDGDIPPSLFQRATMEQLKNLHMSIAVLGVGGWDQADKRVYGRVGRKLRDEYGYLRSFTLALVAGELSSTQASERAKLYIDNAYGEFWSERERALARSGNQEEHWVTEPGACNLCLDAESRGWVPVGTFIIPMHNRCRCHKEYRSYAE